MLPREARTTEPVMAHLTGLPGCLWTVPTGTTCQVIVRHPLPGRYVVTFQTGVYHWTALAQASQIEFVEVAAL